MSVSFGILDFLEESSVGRARRAACEPVNRLFRRWIGVPYLRCGSCGGKALPIATRCPACSKPIEHGRPGSGLELAALRPCRRCDSLLPAHATPCPWCDEPTPHKPRPYALMGAGAASVVVAIVAGLLVWTGGPDSEDSQVALETQSSVEAQTPPEPEEGGILATLEVPSPPEDDAAETSGDTTPGTTPDGVSQSNSAVTQPNAAASPQGAQAERAASETQQTSPQGERRAPEVEPSSPQPPPAAGWITVVARNYANVRVTGSSQAEVLDIIRPGDTVELAEGERNWRPLRRGTLEGWVWVPALELQSEILQDNRVRRDDRIRPDSAVLQEGSAFQDNR